MENVIVILFFLDLEDDASIGSFVAEESDKTSTPSVEEEGIDLRGIISIFTCRFN